MSWQTYVDDHLMAEVEGNTLTSSAILGHDGSIWAQSEKFIPVTLDSEFLIMKNLIIFIFKSSSDVNLDNVV